MPLREPAGAMEVRVGPPPPAHATPAPTNARYVLLMEVATGRYLACGDEGTLSTAPLVSDAALWTLQQSVRTAVFHHPNARHTLHATPALHPAGTAVGEGLVSVAGVGTAVNLTADACPDQAGSQSSRSSASSPGTTFLLLHGPDRRPSEYLRSLRETGYCVMPGLIAPPAVAELRRVLGLDSGRPEPGAMASTVATKVLTNPVAGWIAHQYMHEPEIRLGAGPSVATLLPGQNAEGRGGWHSDFPYAASHTFSPDYPYTPWGRYPDPEESVLGLLYNVCIDAFTAQNGATMFALVPTPGNDRLYKSFKHFMGVT